MQCNSQGCTFYLFKKKEVDVISNIKNISYKAKMGSKKLDSFFGKEDSVVEEEEKKKEQIFKLQYI